jgi:hypothetical protein
MGMLKVHLVASRNGDRVVCACGRTGHNVRGNAYGANDFTFSSPTGKTLFQAITADRPEPKPWISCEACLTTVEIRI